MSQSNTDVEADLNKLLHGLNCSFDEERTVLIQEFINVGEYEVAFESICSTLSDQKALVPSKVHAELKRLGKQLGTDPEYWTRLADNS